MIRKLILIALTILAVSQVQAIEVVNTAGQLSSKVTNYSITDLTVKGTMDASDFYFIVEKLTRLSTLDLSHVEWLARPERCTIGPAISRLAPCLREHWPVWNW